MYTCWLRTRLLVFCAAAVILLYACFPQSASAASVFSDDFNDGNANGWTVTHGTWDVVTDGTPVYRQTSSVEGRTYAGTSSWKDYTVQSRIKMDTFNAGNRVLLAARYQDGNNYYAASLYNNNGGTLELRKKVGGTSTTLVSKSYALTTGTWYTVKLEVEGTALNMYVNGVLQLSATDSSIATGAIGLLTHSGAVAKFDDVAVNDFSAINTDSLFSGYRDFSDFVTGSLTTDTAYASNIVSWQMPHGGFFKSMETKYSSAWNGTDARSDWKSSSGVELGTFDNEATVKEIRFLADMYKKTGNAAFKTSVRKAVDFILNSQYSSGGWPQVYPQRGNYSDYVTFNDDAMVRVMVLIDDMINQRYAFDGDILTSTYRTNLTTALNKGVQYMLNAQIVMSGKRTVWCAQHDPVTFAALGARAYELPSKSGSESVGITAFLMSRPQTPEIRAAAKSALTWFDTVRVDGTRYVRSGPDFFVSDPASVMWYRFYNLDNNNHFFSDRDGLKYYNIMDISEERRLGYSWAGAYAKNLLTLASGSGYYSLTKPLP
ncbi:pectate lyase [Paenibacillus sp. y28]